MTEKPDTPRAQGASLPLPSSSEPLVWLCDDDESMRFVLAHALRQAGIHPQEFESAEAVLATLETGQSPLVLVTDVRMGGMSGLALLERISQSHPSIKVLIMTAFSDLDSAVSSFSKGAFEYLAKPFDLQDALSLVQRALASAQEQAVAQESQQSAQMLAPSAPNKSMIGQASSMQELFRAIGRLSQSHATILITGETGTGKERVAQALHAHSPRAVQAFVAINTAAIPKDLLESELFGHERGAFTGAQALRKGRFEQASGGTLFLDEIGDMPLDLQTRLLRVLSEGVYYRVGGTQALHVDVRVIAATHQDLERRVQEGLFREDLFHRLNVIRLRIPALRERQEDIPLLTEHFLLQAAQHNGTELRRLSLAAMRCLQAYPFRGNVRELENICQWLTIMSPTSVVDVADLPPEVQTAGATKTPAHSESAPTMQAGSASPCAWTEGLHAEALRRLRQNDTAIWDDLVAEAEKTILLAALQELSGNRSMAAQALGIGRNTIARKLGSS